MVTINGGVLVPTRWQSVVEMFYEFVVNMVEEQIGEKGRKYFTLIFTTFTLILSLNLIGLIPYSFASTSHLIVTFGMSLSLFLGITIVGLQIHGLHFFSFFLPAGAPLALAPALVIIELVSYVFRPYFTWSASRRKHNGGARSTSYTQWIRLDHAGCRRFSGCCCNFSFCNRVRYNLLRICRCRAPGLRLYYTIDDLFKRRN